LSAINPRVTGQPISGAPRSLEEFHERLDTRTNSGTETVEDNDRNVESKLDKNGNNYRIDCDIYVNDYYDICNNKGTINNGNRNPTACNY
jgi:hypothetical protein